MKKGSIVEYVGGQYNAAKEIFPLHRNTPYVLSTDISPEQFSDGIKPGVKLQEGGNYIFWAIMFRELLPPGNIDIEQLIIEPQEELV